MDLNCALRDYSITKALTWGNFREHAYVESKKGNLGHRAIHLIVAAAELLPIISQIVSLAEMILVRTFNIVQPLRFRSSVVDKYFRQLMDTSPSRFKIINYSLAERQAFLDLETAFACITSYEKDKQILQLQGKELTNAVTLYEAFADAVINWNNLIWKDHRRESWVYDQIGTPLLSLFKLYEEGKAQPTSDERKYQVIRHASFSDELESQFLYAELLEKGNQKDLEKAKTNYYELFSRNCNAKNNGFALEAGYRVLTRYPKCLKQIDHFKELTLQKLVELGHPQAMSDYGVSLLALMADDFKINMITDLNQKKAFELFQKAAELGVLDGQYNLSVCYRYGIGVAANPKLAHEWCLKAAKAGQTQAMTLLGCLVQDKCEAFEWIKSAADKGNSFAKLYLGKCYETGTLIDLEKAEETYKELTVDEPWKLAKHPYDIRKLKMTAYFRLGNLYLDSSRDELARRAFSAANDIKTFYSTENVVGQMGLKARKDMLDQMIRERQDELVVTWFEQDFCDWSLGFCAEANSRVTPNDVARIRFHKELADRGVAAAQFALGEVYLFGQLDETKNRETAKNYYQLAEQQDHFFARIRLRDWEESILCNPSN